MCAPGGVHLPSYYVHPCTPLPLPCHTYIPANTVHDCIPHYKAGPTPYIRYSPPHHTIVQISRTKARFTLSRGRGSFIFVRRRCKRRCRCCGMLAAPSRAVASSPTWPRGMTASNASLVSSPRHCYPSPLTCLALAQPATHDLF